MNNKTANVHLVYQNGNRSTFKRNDLEGMEATLTKFTSLKLGPEIIKHFYAQLN